MKFFNNAGIPSPANATYAHIFVKNRIELDMLAELNKEYLREVGGKNWNADGFNNIFVFNFQMGITTMGDIISILRHSKTVTEQSFREKIMAENESVKSVAKVNPVSSSQSSRVSSNGKRPSGEPPKQTVSMSRTSVTVVPRRVLPEHEGKYKISLPKGSTQKSREILAKHSAMQSDVIEKKSSIFDRLNSKDVEMSEYKSPSSSSIFKRLGDFKNLELGKRNEDRFKSGILKATPVR